VEQTVPAAARQPTRLIVFKISLPVLAVIAAAGLSGALGHERSAFDALFAGSLVPTVLLAVTLIDVAMLWTVDRSGSSRLLVAAFAFVLALAVAGGELHQKYSTTFEGRFSRVFDDFHRQNFNQLEGLLIGNNLRNGAGITLPVSGAPPKIDTYRMPGYAMFVALAGFIGRAPRDDLTALARSAVYAQVWMFAFALAFFGFNATPLVGAARSAAMSASAAWFPQAFDMTQADSTIVACGLLVTGALCVLQTKARNSATVPLKHHLTLHAALALWFLMRSDILVGWLGISIYLYRRRPLWLMLPVVFYLPIAGSWGLYKKAHGSEFVMSTSNIGHVAFVGLWQTPPHHFIWEPTDESYVTWIERQGYRYAEPDTDRFALREVVRFWFTYPVFVGSGVLYKLYSYCRYGAWAGSLALYPSRMLGVLMRTFGAWCLLGGFLLALLRRRDLETLVVFGWPVLLNLPLFLILQYHARFLDFVSCSLVFSALIYGDDAHFYRHLGTPKRQVALVSLVLLLFLLSRSHLFPLDRIRYVTPLLDPARSSLNRVRP
jgi:hypothetical protein